MSLIESSKRGTNELAEDSKAGDFAANRGLREVTESWRMRAPLFAHLTGFQTTPPPEPSEWNLIPSRPLLRDRIVACRRCDSGPPE